MSPRKHWLLMSFLLYVVIGVVLFGIASRTSWFRLNLRPYSYDYPTREEWETEFNLSTASLDLEALNRGYDFGRDRCFREFYRDSNTVFEKEKLSLFVSGLGETEAGAISAGWSDGLKFIESAKRRHEVELIKEKMSPPTFWHTAFAYYAVLGLAVQLCLWIRALLSKPRS